MLLQSARQQGLAIVQQKIRSRIEWARELRRRREAAAGQERALAQAQASSFQSHRIGQAFMRSLLKYRFAEVPVKVAVFRPRLDVRYRLPGGRLVDGERNYVREDNFWTPHVGELQVFEVPGNHDNMVLEPNVRVLVSQLRRVLDRLGKE